MKPQRKIYLINPKFQLKFSLMISLFMVGLSVIYPFTIYQIIEGIATSSGPEAKFIQERKVDIFLTLGAWQFGYTILIFLACIFFSHKIAGPIYKLNMFLQKISKNEDMQIISFRDGDYFHELADNYNDAIRKIKTTRKQDFEQLMEIKSYLHNLGMVVPDDKKIVINEINKKLIEITERYQDS